MHLFYPVTHTGLIVFEACNNASEQLVIIGFLAKNFPKITPSWLASLVIAGAGTSEHENDCVMYSGVA